MCTSVYSSLPLFTLFVILIISSMRMSAEGLPLHRQERSIDKGVLAGEDFLSVFMRATNEAYREIQTSTTTQSPPATTTLFDGYIRETRSLPHVTTPEITEDNIDHDVTTILNEFKGQSSDSSTATEQLPDTTPESVPSEESPSIISNANKHEFGVEETEPITTSSDLVSAEFNRVYPARVQPLPGNQFQATSSFLHHEFDENKEPIQPIHQTLIFHNNPREPGRARSVSYSTVIQALPNSRVDKTWENDKQQDQIQQNTRHERHYDSSQSSFNTFNDNLEKFKVNETKPFADHHNSRDEKNWENPEIFPPQEASTKPNNLQITTERNWEVQEKPYTHVPTVYGFPEQNYEVDESASVMSNGRLHGVQPSPPTLPTSKQQEESKKTDDNQKIGYVVQGRNYRKYRVEERTSDGFIVGEYGVVSNDDGSLRGVRYTADGTISRRLIQDALMKFLSL